MIKLTEWDRLYRHNIDWAIRRMEPDCLKIYNDTQQDWVDALFAFNKVQEDVFKNYSVLYRSGNKYHRECIKGIELTADQLFEVFHKHLNQYTNKTVRDFIFHWWNDLRYSVKDAQPPLDQPWIYYKPATKEEIAKARRDFGVVEEERYGALTIHSHSFKEDANVLEYRGNRFIIDDEWGCAWTRNKKGEVVSFQLEWDWWYPIDEYLDLYNI